VSRVRRLLEPAFRSLVRSELRRGHTSIGLQLSLILQYFRDRAMFQGLANHLEQNRLKLRHGLETDAPVERDGVFVEIVDVQRARRKLVEQRLANAGERRGR